MDLPPGFDQAVLLLHDRLKTLPHPWTFTGSLSMALQGMNLEVHDIDVQTDREGAYAIQARFPEYTTCPVAFSGTERIRSHFGALEIGGVKVEIMGDVQSRPPDGDWAAPPRLPMLVRWAEYAGMRLPVLDLEYEYQAYARLGRAAKAARIRHFLDSRDNANGC